MNKSLYKDFRVLGLIKFIHSLRLVLLFHSLICTRSNTILQLQKLNDTTCYSETYIKRTRASLNSKHFYRFFCQTNRYIQCSTPELIGHQRPSRGAKYRFHCINKKNVLSSTRYLNNNNNKNKAGKECFTNFKTRDKGESFQTRHNLNFTKQLQKFPVDLFHRPPKFIRF